MQPDDLEFFEEWTPPAHHTSSSTFDYPTDSDLPFMNRLRQKGVQFTAAYAASSMCGTSRYRYVRSCLFAFFLRYCLNNI